MKFAELSPGRMVVALFALSLLFLGVIGWVSYRSTLRLIELGRGRSQAHQVFEQLQTLFSELQDAETGQRGYVIAGDERYLEPYRSASNSIQQSLRDVETSTSDNAELRSHFARLKALTAQKLISLQNVIEIRRSQGLDAALPMVQSGEGRRIMDNIRQVMAQMKAEQLAVITQRTSDMQATARQTTAVVIFGSLLSIIVVGAATLQVRREISRRRLSEEKFQGLLESAPDAVIVTNQRGKIVLANAQADRLFGYDREQLLGQDVEILLPEGSRARHTGQRNDFFSSPRARPMGVGLELSGRRKDGTVFPVEVSLSPLNAEEGTFVSAAVRDTSERKKAEAALRNLNRELEQRTVELTALNKELEAFSYSVSHDLRAPLRSIDGFSLALLEDCDEKLDEAGRDYLRRVRAGSQRMAQLIDDLIGLSRISRGELRVETVDLSAAARSLAEELQASEATRRVDWSVAEGLTTQGDERLLRVALDNLLRNAWKFTSRRPDARIEIGTLNQENGNRVFFVRDNGAGFDMAYAQKLFSPFQRLHSTEEFKGTGIGLATVQRIIHRHGGRIWAEGQPGQGATFYFTLGS